MKTYQEAIKFIRDERNIKIHQLQMSGAVDTRVFIGQLIELVSFIYDKSVKQVKLDINK